MTGGTEGTPAMSWLYTIIRIRRILARLYRLTQDRSSSLMFIHQVAMVQEQTLTNNNSLKPYF